MTSIKLQITEEHIRRAAEAGVSPDASSTWCEECPIGQALKDRFPDTPMWVGLGYVYRGEYSNAPRESNALYRLSIAAVEFRRLADSIPPGALHRERTLQQIKPTEIELFTVEPQETAT
jgi:hypothetical protein